MDSISLISSIVYGWGIVVIMIGASVVFNKKKWADLQHISSQEVE